MSGFMYGISNFLQFITFGMIFFLAAIFVANYGVKMDNSLSAVFLILFACISAGDKSNMLQNLENVKGASSWFFSLMEQKD